MKHNHSPAIDAVVISCFRADNMPAIIDALVNSDLIRQVHVLHQPPSRRGFANARNVFFSRNFGPAVRHSYASDNLRDADYALFQDDDWRIVGNSTNYENMVSAIKEFGRHTSVMGPVVKQFLESPSGGRFERLETCDCSSSTALESPPFFVLGRMHLLKIDSLVRHQVALRRLNIQCAAEDSFVGFGRADDIALSYLVSTLDGTPVRRVQWEMIEMPSFSALCQQQGHTERRLKVARELIDSVHGGKVNETRCREFIK